MHSDSALSTGSSTIAVEADRVLREFGLLENPYLRALEDGTLALDGFRRTQEQFYFAVLHFARPMAALLSRIPDPSRRVDILHNLLEEHGELDPARFHEATFRVFLRSIGASDDPRVQCAPGPEVEAFNRILDGACVAGDVVEAVACIGMIEYAFADISATIARSVVARGWLREEALAHYGSELFLVVEDEWRHPDRSARVLRGLRLGAYAFERLYRDLLRSITASEDPPSPGCGPGTLSVEWRPC